MPSQWERSEISIMRLVLSHIWLPWHALIWFNLSVASKGFLFYCKNSSFVNTRAVLFPQWLNYKMSQESYSAENRKSPTARCIIRPSIICPRGVPHPVLSRGWGTPSNPRQGGIPSSHVRGGGVTQSNPGWGKVPTQSHTLFNYLFYFHLDNWCSRDRFYQ